MGQGGTWCQGNNFLELQEIEIKSDIWSSTDMTLKVYPKNKWRSADTIVLRSNVKPHAEYWIASFVREESEIFVDIIQNTISPLVREACFCFRPELLLEGRSKGGRDIGQESQNLVNLNKSQNVGAAPLKFECFFCAELVTSVVLPHDQINTQWASLLELTACPMFGTIARRGF